MWTDDKLHAYIRELMGNENSLSFGVYQDEVLTGIALGRLKSWYEGTEYWIDEFGILPKMQQAGIGVWIYEIHRRESGGKGSRIHHASYRETGAGLSVLQEKRVSGKKRKRIFCKTDWEVMAK